MKNVDSITLREKTHDFEEQVSVLMGEICIQMGISYSKIDNFYKGIDFFIDELNWLKSEYEEFFHNDYVLSKLSFFYVDFLANYLIKTNVSDINYGLIKLIDIFEYDKNKGILLNHMFLQSILQNQEDISTTILQLIKSEYQYIIEKNYMPLINEHFVSNILIKSLNDINFYIIHDYIYSIEFYKTEESIKNTLALISIAATKKFNNLKEHYGGSDDDFFNKFDMTKFDFYQSFIRKKDFLFDFKNNKVIVYYIYNLKIHTINADNNLYELISKGKKTDSISEYIREEIYFQKLSNSFQYYILKDYTNNGNNLSSYLYNNIAKDITYINKINNRDLNEEMFNQFIKSIFTNKLYNNHIINNILESFDLKDELILEIFISNNNRIRKELYNNKSHLKEDFDFVLNLFK